ncbi:MAG: hypothetical protein U1E84_14245 [Rhodoferax sp.]
MQHLIVYCIVLACGAYALWVLMPSALRRILAARLVRLPLGSVWRQRMQQAAKPASGCDCSGCDAVVDKRNMTNPRRVIRLHSQHRD